MQSAEITHGSTAPPEVLEGVVGGGDSGSRGARVGVALLNNKQVGGCVAVMFTLVWILRYTRPIAF